MTSSMTAKIIAFVLYLAFMVYIGLKNAGKNTGASDFFLGGRTVGPWMTALSAEASDMSGWLLMGLPGLAYLGGIREVFWTALGLTIGTYLNWLFVAKPLRKCTVEFGDAITIPEFLTNRFRDKTHLISVISVVFIVLFFTIYTASGLVACAKLFESVFNLPYFTGLVIGFAVILSYTILGGFLAVCATDFVQGTLMFVALIILVIVMTFSLGGPESAVQKVGEFGAMAMDGRFSQAMKEAFTKNQNYSALDAVSALVWGLGYFGMPHIIVRFMGIRSNADVKISRRIATVWVVVAFAGAFIAGSCGAAFLYDKNGEILQSSETVVSAAIQTIFSGNGFLTFIGGIFLCAILAAAMSTADSQLLVASSAFSRDIFKGIAKTDADEKTVLLVSRIMVFVIAAVAFFLALNPESSIFSLVSYAWAGFGATFGPLVLLALFWRRTTNKGAIAGLLAGGITVVLWHNLGSILSAVLSPALANLSPASSKSIFETAPILGVYELLPGFLIGLFAAIIVSLLDKMPEDAILQKFDHYKKMPD